MRIKSAEMRMALHRGVLSMGLAGVVSLIVWISYVLATGNFHVVIAGEAYRAGQMNSNELVRCIQRYHIRSVVNLRGAHPGRSWYEAEIRAAASQAAIHRSIQLSSTKPVSAARTSELIRIFREVPKPVLIHCDGGADRSGFAAAVYAAEMAHASQARAEKQFRIWYGYLPFVWKKKAQLRESFRAYFIRARPHPIVARATAEP